MRYMLTFTHRSSQRSNSYYQFGCGAVLPLLPLLLLPLTILWRAPRPLSTGEGAIGRYQGAKDRQEGKARRASCPSQGSPLLDLSIYRTRERVLHRSTLPIVATTDDCASSCPAHRREDSTLLSSIEKMAEWWPTPLVLAIDAWSKGWGWQPTWLSEVAELGLRFPYLEIRNSMCCPYSNLMVRERVQLSLSYSCMHHQRI
jgi:hypothetical protein